MIPDHNDKLTKQLLADSIPQWENPGFTEQLMHQIAAADELKIRRRLILLLCGFVAAIALTGFSFVNLARLRSSALSGPINGFQQVGNWIGGNEYILLPLVILILTKRLIDSRFRNTRSANS